MNCGGKKLGKTCPFPVLPAGASLPRLEPDEPPAELEADRNGAVKSPELSSDCGIKFKAQIYHSHQSVQICEMT